MNKSISIFLSAIVMLAFAAIACTPDQTDEQETKKEQPQDEPEAEGPQPGTYTFVASTLQGLWKAGDKIYVHGAYAAYAQTITLSAKDISGDGKTATATLDKVTEKPADPDGLYAAWPADAIRKGSGKIGVKTTFQDTDRLLTVAYLEGTTFKFMDVSSTLSFTVSGDYDRFALAAGNKDGLNFTDFEVTCTSAKTTYSRTNDGSIFLMGDLESGKPVQLWMPGNVAFNGGLTIYVGKNGNWPLAYSQDQTISLTPGKSKDLGDITAALGTYEGPGPKIPQMGERTKYTVEVCGLSGLCLSADGDFLWGLGDRGELAQIGFDGKLLHKVMMRWKSNNDEGGYDTEGITVNPLTGDLLVSMEQNYVGIIPFADQASLFDNETAYNPITTIFRIPDAQNYGNSGTEGISYYKDGKVYVGAQDGPAHLFLYGIESKEELVNVRLNKTFPSISEIAGLCYDPVLDWLWIIDSNWHNDAPPKFFALKGDATELYAAYSLPHTSNPESISVDHKNKCIWVGDDGGDDDESNLYRYDFPDLDDFIQQ